jgi:hypothetical protein
MTGIQADLFGHEDCEYDLDYILNNPIPARCTQQKHWGCKGRGERIRAPSLENVRCFWCGGKLVPVDKKAYQERVANLWQHVSREQEP